MTRSTHTRRIAAEPLTARPNELTMRDIEIVARVFGFTDLNALIGLMTRTAPKAKEQLRDR
ncbi:hypothetical protein [Nocardia pseudovaccinii]|uniref:hypothetical protein n=1 Tax=Nocardia pseudovaccinii TaxID=189540 RepID=UPI0007A435E2|nr:hypothetical protein [Nocardia pseudovaccinii]